MQVFDEAEDECQIFRRHKRIRNLNSYLELRREKKKGGGGVVISLVDQLYSVSLDGILANASAHIDGR